MPDYLPQAGNVQEVGRRGSVCSASLRIGGGAVLGVPQLYYPSATARQPGLLGLALRAPWPAPDLRYPPGTGSPVRAAQLSRARDGRLQCGHKQKAGPTSPILQRAVHLNPTFHRLGVHCFLAPRGLRTDMVTRGCAAAAAGGLVGTWNAGRADGWSAFGDPAADAV